MNTTIKSFVPAIVVFIILNAMFIIMANSFRDWGFNIDVLLIGNLILFLICAVSFFMGFKALQSKNTHAFLRLVYGSFILKLILIAATALTYIMVEKKNVNKPAIFFCMGLYIIYTFIEVSTLMKTARRKHV